MPGGEQYYGREASQHSRRRDLDPKPAREKVGPAEGERVQKFDRGAEKAPGKFVKVVGSAGPLPQAILALHGTKMYRVRLRGDIYVGKSEKYFGL